jgi:hypothetical protein
LDELVERGKHLKDADRLTKVQWDRLARAAAHRRGELNGGQA